MSEKITVDPGLLKDLADTNFGEVLTNPLYSRVVRSALGLAITFVGTKVFKAEASAIAVQDYVELALVLIGVVSVIWYRWKTTHSIRSVSEVADELLPLLQRAATPAIQKDLLEVIRARNQKVYDVIVTKL